MRPKFQPDANLHFEIVAGVLRREPAVDFQSAQEVFEEGLGDDEVLELAASEDRILISHDVSTMPGHFERLLARRGNSPDYNVKATGRRAFRPQASGDDNVGVENDSDHLRADGVDSC